MLKTNKEEYIIDSFISLINPIKDIDQYYKLKILDKNKKIYRKPIRKLTKKEIENKIVNVNNLLLEITQDCNLRCQYCVHNGTYENIRTHKQSKMNLDTGKIAIDFFLKLLFSKMRTKNFKEVMISFFGGEPLLEKTTVFETIRYARLKAKDSIGLKFMITTNGVLLTSTVIDKCVSEKVKLDISLDGPEDQHDKFRKFSNGKGSWESIMKNVKYIKKRYPEYYGSNVKYQLTVHPYHDIIKIQDYFLENSDLFNAGNVIINSFRVDKLNAEKIERGWLNEGFEKLYENASQKLDKQKWFYYKYFFQDTEKRLTEGPTRFCDENTSYTGTCFPGERLIFVAPDGSIKLCEKSGEFYIGSIHSGFNFKLLKALWYKWEKEIDRVKCWECNNKFTCYWCFERGLDCKNGKINIDKKSCQIEINQTIDECRAFLEHKEKTSPYRDDTIKNLMQSI